MTRFAIYRCLYVFPCIVLTRIDAKRDGLGGTPSLTIPIRWTSPSIRKVAVISTKKSSSFCQFSDVTLVLESTKNAMSAPRLMDPGPKIHHPEQFVVASWDIVYCFEEMSLPGWPLIHE